MDLSREAKVVSGISLLAFPTIMYGGATLLGVLTAGEAGVPAGNLVLDERQWALFRAGHAHAGVWLIFSLVIQVLLDAATLAPRSKWLARITAPAASVLVSGGFFGLAFSPGFRWLLYLGAACLAVAVVLTGVGLIRRPRLA
jgi:protein-S-isoprenylcysteine O-methyltransferase Ste14